MVTVFFCVLFQVLVSMVWWHCKSKFLFFSVLINSFSGFQKYLIAARLDRTHETIRAWSSLSIFYVLIVLKLVCTLKLLGEIWKILMSEFLIHSVLANLICSLAWEHFKTLQMTVIWSHGSELLYCISFISLRTLV